MSAIQLSDDELRQLLLTTKRGREVLRKCLLRRPARVLFVETETDVEAFAEKTVCFQKAQLLATQSVEAEKSAQELLRLQLRGVWRDLYWPGMRRAIVSPRTVTVDQHAGDEWFRFVLKGVLAMKREK